MSFPRQIRAVVFDMDGLLIDSEVIVREACIKAAARMGHPMSHELFARSMGCSDAQHMAILRDHYGPDFEVDRFRALEDEEIRKVMAGGVCLKAGVVELLDHLDAAGLPAAVATSSRRDSARRHLGDHGLWDRFQAVVGREDVLRHKPMPDPYLEAARRLDIDPAGCLALEDSHNGVRAAHAAGMMVVMVPDLLEATEEMRGLCVRIAQSLHEVERLMRG